MPTRIDTRIEVVEDDCIGCGLCSERAPENFEIPVGTSLAQVSKQPETPTEEEACLEASDYSPMGGILTDAADPATADGASGSTEPSLNPAGDSTPVDPASTRLEN